MINRMFSYGGRFRAHLRMTLSARATLGSPGFAHPRAPDARNDHNGRSSPAARAHARGEASCCLIRGPGSRAGQSRLQLCGIQATFTSLDKGAAEHRIDQFTALVGARVACDAQSNVGTAREGA